MRATRECNCADGRFGTQTCTGQWSSCVCESTAATGGAGGAGGRLGSGADPAAGAAQGGTAASAGASGFTAGGTGGTVATGAAGAGSASSGGAGGAGPTGPIPNGFGRMTIRWAWANGCPAGSTAEVLVYPYHQTFACPTTPITMDLPEPTGQPTQVSITLHGASEPDLLRTDIVSVKPGVLTYVDANFTGSPGNMDLTFMNFDATTP